MKSSNKIAQNRSSKKMLTPVTHSDDSRHIFGVRLPAENANLKVAEGKVFWLILFLMNVFIVRSADLAVAPVYSRLNIIIANPETGLLDKTVIGFNPNSTNTFNPTYDANKLMGAPDRQTLYTLKSGQWMSINIWPDEGIVDTVEMGLYPGINATFTFSFTGLDSFDSTCYIYLEDKKLNTWFNIRNGDYTFASLTTDDESRFLLHFTPPMMVTGTDTTCSDTSTINIKQPGFAIWNYKITDSSYVIIDTGILSESQPKTLRWAAGNYKLVLVDTQGYTVVKKIVVDRPVTIVGVDFRISDSIVRIMQPIILNGSIAIIDSTNTGALSYLWNFDNGTTGTGSDTTIIYTNPGVYSLCLTITNQSGCRSSQIQTITVTGNQATSFANMSKVSDLNIWSNGNKVYVDFTSQQTHNALVTVYNILGQEISSESFAISGLYQREFGSLATGYIIIKAENNQVVNIKKAFINDNK